MPVERGYAYDSDRLDTFHATVAAAANNILVMDANARFPEHDVTGALGHVGQFANKVDSLHQQVRLAIKAYTGRATGVAFDVLKFTCTGADIAGSSKFGACSGIVQFTVWSRSTTAPNYAFAAARWLVTVVSMYSTGGVMSCTIQQLGTTQTVKVAMTLALTEKAGSTYNSLVLQLTCTMASWTVSLNEEVGFVDFSNFANLDALFITPAFV